MRVYEINFSCHTSIFQLACMHPHHSFLPPLVGGQN